MQKFFNIVLVTIFITLVFLFAYKMSVTPNIFYASKNPTIDHSDGKQDIADHAKNTGSDSKKTSLSTEELHDIIHRYIIDHPEDILKSLEKMQQKKVSQFKKKADDYLANNRKHIETINNPPVIGAAKSDITIVIFYDYNCSFCTKANKYMNKALALDLGIEFILRPIAVLGDSSLYAAKAALAVDRVAKDSFLAFHNDLINSNVTDESTVKKLLTKYKVDYSIVENEINSYATKQLIVKNFELAQKLGIQGAPSYVINGHFFPGLIPLDKLQLMIEKIRATRSQNQSKQIDNIHNTKKEQNQNNAEQNQNKQ